jgi:predicted Zn-dependent peptidase
MINHYNQFTGLTNVSPVKQTFMPYFTYTFPNGLRLIHLPSDSPVSYCGFAVNAGTRDEEPQEYGLAHFVEHLLFKGTPRRKAWHILNRMENVGGELNAYTTKEDTFIYSIFMEEHYRRAFELLTDIVFHSCFPPHEIEKEVDVILDEINTYKDNPSELIFDEFEDLLFNGHALGHNILGNEESLMQFTSESGLSFTRRFYAPSNMVFFSMGRIKPEKIIRLTKEAWNEAVSTIVRHRTPPTPLPPQNKRIRQDTHQTHIISGGRSYNMYESDKKRIPLFLLNNLLGGPGMNSRLNLSLREKHGLVYNVESNLTSYTDTGLASIYFGTDPKHTEKALHLVGQELKRICGNKLSTAQLATVKKQVTGQLGISNDNKESLFLNLGKQFLHHNRYETLSEVCKKIEHASAEDILEVANEVFSPDSLSTLIYE